MKYIKILVQRKIKSLTLKPKNNNNKKKKKE